MMTAAQAYTSILDSQSKQEHGRAVEEHKVATEVVRPGRMQKRRRSTQ